jgi:nicotinate-nucleotide adenylyltransferase
VVYFTNDANKYSNRFSHIIMEIVSLYGGSFNPSTEAHRRAGLHLLEQLYIDAVWYLISPQNPFKAKADMARFEDRIAMAKINLEGYPKLVVQDIEAEYVRETPNGVIETAETLKNLTRDFPQHRFIWAMGADNFVNFHTWGGAAFISSNFPIAVIPREGFTQAALQSPSAQIITHLDDPRDMMSTNGWHMLNVTANDINATNCRSELTAGNIPACMRPEVAHYALKNHVYASTLTIDRS